MEYQKLSLEIQQELSDQKEKMLYDKLFKLYKKDKPLQKLLDRAENGDYDTYTFDESGMLCGVIELNKKDYPFLQEYLDFNMLSGYVSDYGLELCCGEAITVNWNHGRNEYFIYDHESRKSIIEKYDEKPEEYYHAKIEQWQRKKGVFNDVVKIGYYGEYLGHVNTKLGNASDKEVQKIIDQCEVTENESD